MLLCLLSAQLATLVRKPTKGIGYKIGIEALAANSLIGLLNAKLKHKAQLVLFIWFFFQTVISNGRDRCFLKWQEICQAEYPTTYSNCFINIACVYGFYFLAMAHLLEMTSGFLMTSSSARLQRSFESQVQLYAYTENYFVGSCTFLSFITCKSPWGHWNTLRDSRSVPAKELLA